MSSHAPDIAAVHAEITRLTPLVKRIHHASLRLKILSAAGSLAPTALAFTSAFSDDAIPLNTGIVGATLLAAVATQVSRWEKGRLGTLFKKAHDETSPETRPLLLGFLKETFTTKIGQTKNVLGREDFNINDRMVALGLASSALVGINYLPLAGVMLFSSTLLRETRDSAFIETSARHTLNLYNSVKRGPG